MKSVSILKFWLKLDPEVMALYMNTCTYWAFTMKKCSRVLKKVKDFLNKVCREEWSVVLCPVYIYIYMAINLNSFWDHEMKVIKWLRVDSQCVCVCVCVCTFPDLYTWSVRKVSDLWPGKRKWLTWSVGHLITLKVVPLGLHTLLPAVPPLLEACRKSLFRNGV